MNLHWEIEFDQAGGLLTDGGLEATLAGGRPGDLFVFCPGWHADRDSARELSAAMFGLIAEALPPARRAGTGFVTVLWPSLLFPEDAPALDGPVLTGPAGSVQATPELPAPRPSSGAALLTALAPAFPGQRGELTRIAQLLDTRPRELGRLGELHRLASCLVTTPNKAVDDDGECLARTARTRVALEALALLAPGADAGLGDMFGTLWSGGRELARVLSYYEMKNRAGVIGEVGLGPLLDRLHAASPGLRVHLVGHSFGARLVGFALAGLAGLAGPVSPVKSLVAVQGAFSHFSFAGELPIAPSRAGALAQFTGRVDGPLLATFSAADRALGWWYPNASALVSQHDRGRRAASARELGYRWGALGHDGYQQRSVVSRRLEPAGSWYDWQPGTFYRMDASHVINRDLSWLAGAHSDIRKPELAWAAVSAAGLAHRQRTGRAQHLRALA